MQVLVSHLVLVLLLGLVLGATIPSFSALSRSVDRVLEDNYQSIMAATKMREAIEEDEKALALILLGRSKDATQRLDGAISLFNSGFAEAKDSINEPDEDTLVSKIDSEYKAYRVALDHVIDKSSSIENARPTYLAELAPSRKLLLQNISGLVNMNKTAMYRENDLTKRLVQTASIRSISVTGIALALAIGLTFLLARRLLSPLKLLTSKAEAIGAGNLEERIDWNRTDEFGALGRAFNSMAEKLLVERKNEQYRLQRAQKMSDQALESLYDPVIVTNSKGYITHLNKAAEALFGPSPEAPRQPIIAHLGDQLIMRAINKTLDLGESETSEEQVPLIPITVNGIDRTYRLRVTNIKSDDGKTLGAVAVMEDITHLKELDRLKTEFIGVASHEMRTPVASLLISAQLLDEGALGELTPSQKEVVALQKQDLNRLDRLMKELLDITKLQAGTSESDLRPTQCEELVEEAVSATRSVAKQKGVELSVATAPDLQPVKADRSQIERVLINLISNAIRHTRSGGHVKIRAEGGGDQVTFSVEDTGEGIPKEYLDKIFDRFVQVPGATGGGAGLGLSIAYKIVKAHGGKIWAESTLGEGSAFHFTLPTLNDAVGEKIS